MANREKWDMWMEISRAVDDARNLAVIADLDCVDSICSEEKRENAKRALVSVISGLLERAHELLNKIEPDTSGERA